MVELQRAPNLRGSPHGFTSRRGGVSEGALASLNLALRADERPERLVENWSRVCGELGFPTDAVALLDQVHGADVLRVERGAGPLTTLGAADAAWTDRPGVLLAVRVADCVPVLLAGEGVVAVAHAGWRGTASGVVGALLAALAAAGFAPERLQAAIGPCISGAAYEVGDEVVAGLRAAGVPDDHFLIPSRPRPHVDLRRAVAAQLRAAGVPEPWVDPRCTATDPALYSHRRDGLGAGRFAGVVGLRA